MWTSRDKIFYWLPLSDRSQDFVAQWLQGGRIRQTTCQGLSWRVNSFSESSTPSRPFGTHFMTFGPQGREERNSLSTWDRYILIEKLLLPAEKLLLNDSAHIAEITYGLEGISRILRTSCLPRRWSKFAKILLQPCFLGIRTIPCWNCLASVTDLRSSRHCPNRIPPEIMYGRIRGGCYLAKTWSDWVCKRPRPPDEGILDRSVAWHRPSPGFFPIT
jgi:hypothetical protein